ncbi:hypothetical protein Tco_0256764 [Tanacetum coccineum]
MLDTQQFTYIVDMFRDTFHLPVETPENPFVTPANIKTIETFMNRVGYQGVVDKLIIADLMKKFPNIPKRLEEDYHSIKDDVPLVSVYTMGNVLVRGMLILDAPLSAEIREMDDFKEYETVSPTISVSPLVSKKRKQIAGESSSPRKSLKITIKQKQIVKKDDDDSEDRIEPGSHKDNLEVVVDDDDDKERETKDDKMGINTIIEDRDAFRSQVPNFVYKEFKVHAPAIIAELFNNHVQSNVIHVHPTITTSTETESSADLEYQLYLKMKRNLQDRADDIALWEALRLNKNREVSPVDISGMVFIEFAAHGPKLIEELFRKHMQNTTLNRYPKTKSSTATTSSVDLQQQLYLSMQTKPQDQAVDPEIWELK